LANPFIERVAFSVANLALLRRRLNMLLEQGLAALAVFVAAIIALL
jgi:hypothetical protein